MLIPYKLIPFLLGRKIASLLPFWFFFMGSPRVFSFLNLGPLTYLRKASIYRSLEMVFHFTFPKFDHHDYDDEEVFEENEEFEFVSVCKAEDDVVMLDGQSSPVFLVFNRDLLLSDQNPTKSQQITDGQDLKNREGEEEDDDEDVRQGLKFKFQKKKPGGASQEIGPDAVYMTAQEMNRENTNLDLGFNITWNSLVGSGGAQYLVRLHFCDIVSHALNLLYFNVYLNGYLAYEDLDLLVLTSHVLASPNYVDFVVDLRWVGWE
uniref:Malectin-like domain-containing protein n=1 Tax=Quercus lobata TaxID=97700 RepID=A0A7N2LEL8_QUELO